MRFSLENQSHHRCRSSRGSSRDPSSSRRFALARGGCAGTPRMLPEKTEKLSRKQQTCGWMVFCLMNNTKYEAKCLSIHIWLNIFIFNSVFIFSTEKTRGHVAKKRHDLCSTPCQTCIQVRHIPFLLMTS